MDDRQVELAPFSRGSKPLGGFIVSGRWPDTTHEWAQLLTLVVRMAAVPGMLGRTSVFRSLEDRPQVSGSIEHPVGLLLMEGPVLGEDAPRPGTLGNPQPSAVLLLHPPSENSTHVASGCLLLPGLPHLGLDHRAAWVDAEADGTVSRLVSHHDVDPLQDPDTAVLAMLIAA